MDNAKKNSICAKLRKNWLIICYFIVVNQYHVAMGILFVWCGLSDTLYGKRKYFKLTWIFHGKKLKKAWWVAPLYFFWDVVEGKK